MGPQYTSTSHDFPNPTMGAPATTSSAPIPITKSVRIALDVATHSQFDSRGPVLESAAFSPVNENGCFEFDRIIKSGEILKKNRKTKTYKPFHLVLRPLNLSLYADKEHTALRHSIPLTEISAVARRRRTKRPRPGLFSVFTPERNFHFDAGSDSIADQWVDQLRVSARIDQWDSGVGTSEEEGEVAEEPAAQPTASAPRTIPINRSTSNSGIQAQALGPYGTPVGSFSSISSFGAANFPGSSISLAGPMSSPENPPIPEHPEHAVRPAPFRRASAVEVDQERVLRNGRLILLRSRGGVRKWKPVWAVLRVKSLAIYPNEDEYAPLLIIPFPSIVNSVEIDSPSRNKKRQFCMQIITEERNWRFCAQDEDDLAAWLGTIKSLLAKRRVAATETQTGAGTSS